MTCNLCGGGRFEHLLTNVEKTSARLSGEPRHVVICRDCGLLALDATGLTPERLAGYYATFNHFETPGAASPEFQRLSEDRFDWIERHAGAVGRRDVLDVGCGCGYLLHLFERRGDRARGVDYSPAMIAAVRDLYGIPGIVGGFSPELAGRSCYDLVTSTKVLEHLLDPAAAVEGFFETLRPGGLVFLEVPDSEFPVADQLPDFFAFDHLYHFTERTLGRLVEGRGFEVMAVDHVANVFDSGNPGHALRLLARKGERAGARYAATNDYARQRAVVAAYRAAHERYLAGLAARISAVRARVGGDDLAIYCAGEHTSALLEHVDLRMLSIRCIFDGDRAVSGRSLKGIPIRHSGDIAASGIRHFLLSTTNHEAVIWRMLKAASPDNRVYGLYHEFD